jgi:general secretion pathway protein D
MNTTRLYPSASILAAILLAAAPAARAGALIDFLDLADCPVSEAARLVTSLTGETVVVSESARTKTVDVLIEGLTVEAALKVLSRSAGLVYRYDADAGLYTLLELEEYRRTAQAEAEGPVQTRGFKVGPANLTQIAGAIQQLFGFRVVVQAGEAIEDFREAPGQLSGGFNSRSQRVFGVGGMGGVGRVPTSLNRTVGGLNRGMGGVGGLGGFGGLGVQGAQLVQPGFGGMGFGAMGLGGMGFDPRLLGNQSFAANGLPFGGAASQEGGINAEEALGLETRRAALGSEAAATLDREQRARESGEPLIFVSLNYEHSLLLVRTADTAAMDEIQTLVENLDIKVPQVILEMKILQLDVGDGLTAGVSLNGRTLNEQFAVKDRDPVTGAPLTREFIGDENTLGLGNFATEPAATLAYRLLSEQIQARIDLLASDNRVEVVATPVLIATNNRSAQIEVGEERIITVGASTDQITSPLTGAVQTIVTTETEKRTIGIVLDILPRINDDGTVTLSVYQESTTLKPANNTIQVGTETVLIDSVDTANVDATVVARDGHTIAVGGLIRSEGANNDTKVPVLGDIPVIKHAFQRRERSSRKTEIILLITPHLIGEADDGMETSRQLASRLSDHHWNVGGEAQVEQGIPELGRYRTDATRGYRSLTGDPEALPSKTQHWEVSAPAREIPAFSTKASPGASEFAPGPDPAPATRGTPPPFSTDSPTAPAAAASRAKPFSKLFRRTESR